VPMHAGSTDLEAERFLVDVFAFLSFCPPSQGPRARSRAYSSGVNEGRGCWGWELHAALAPRSYYSEHPTGLRGPVLHGTQRWQTVGSGSWNIPAAGGPGRVAELARPAKAGSDSQAAAVAGPCAGEHQMGPPTLVHQNRQHSLAQKKI